METTIESQEKISNKIEAKLKEKSILIVIKFFFLLIVWLIFVQQNYKDSKVFFVSCFIYSSSFVYEYINFLFSHKIESSKCRKYIYFVSGIVLIIFFVSSLLFLLNLVFIDEQSHKTIYIDLLGCKYSILNYKTFILLTVSMPLLSLINYGEKIGGIK